VHRLIGVQQDVDYHAGMCARGYIWAFAAALGTVMPVWSQPMSPQTWHIVEQTNRTHNETTRLLTTTSTNTYTSEDSSIRHATLQLRCRSPLHGSITISIDSADTFAVKSDSITTLPVRLDAEPPIAAGWANLTLHQILLYDLRDLLPSHRHISIDLPLGPTLTQTVTFDLSQLASAMRDSNCPRRL